MTAYGRRRRTGLKRRKRVVRIEGSKKDEGRIQDRKRKDGVGRYGSVVVIGV